MKAREWCSSKRWVWRARLKRCLFKLVTDTLRLILAEKKEENMDGNSAVLQEVDRDGDLAVPRSSF